MPSGSGQESDLVESMIWLNSSSENSGSSIYSYVSKSKDEDTREHQEEQRSSI